MSKLSFASFFPRFTPRRSQIPKSIFISSSKLTKSAPTYHSNSESCRREFTFLRASASENRYFQSTSRGGSAQVSKLQFRHNKELLKLYWKNLLSPNDIIVDATCGNGKDTSFIASILSSSGKIYAIDIQENAIRNTKSQLELDRNRGVISDSPEIIFVNKSHETFPVEIMPFSVSLVNYNLGYLPGIDSDKTIVTKSEITMKSLNNALSLIKVGGIICVVAYIGHEEGQIEDDYISVWVKTLNNKFFSCTNLTWPNREKAPRIYIIERIQR